MQLREVVNAEALDVLTQVGLLAACTGMATEADQVFDGLRAVYAESAEMRSLHAAAMVAGYRLAEASALLGETLQLHPENAAARGLLAGVKREMGDASWRALAKQVQRESKDDFAVRLAEQLLMDDTPTNAGMNAFDYPALARA